MRFFQILLALAVMIITSSCGKPSATISTTGFPAVSVKCGSQACVK